MERKKSNKRPSWDEYFVNMVGAVAERGTCDRGKAGCVIVKDKYILVTGYVGSPPGTGHCDEVGHLLHKVIDEDGKISQHCVRTTHAEQNAICQAAKRGISLEGATLYCKMAPCLTCAKMIVTVGIKRVVCQRNYHGAGLTPELFLKTGVKLEVLENVMETYKDM
ncbi:MAG: cytidine/deoxycytidylate deaminase family protein [Patescibacteria group bacterium]|nr:cytidine/deoxycytidylate deaminase family protein [Patescibacteria group bacterium]